MCIRAAGRNRGVRGFQVANERYLKTLRFSLIEGFYLAWLQFWVHVFLGGGVMFTNLVCFWMFLAFRFGLQGPGSWSRFCHWQWRFCIEELKTVQSWKCPVRGVFCYTIYVAFSYTCICTHTSMSTIHIMSIYIELLYMML